MTAENKKTDETAVKDSLPVPICSLGFLTAEWLYKALRPDMSWEINADKAHWEYEAWKLRSSMMRFSANDEVSDAKRSLD